MPVLDQKSLEFISRSAEQTRRIGMRLGALLQTGDLICLVGDLGAGKTTFVQGLAAGWGSPDMTSSPTFVIVNVYRRPEGGRMFHMDAYRLASSDEAEDLDIDAMLENGPLVVEWADRIQPVFPEGYLWISLRWIEESQRDMVFSAQGNRHSSLLDHLRIHISGARS
jgi:tRNA threonylcarbamoyladenosine biosynthesis protein TsaE